jgi:AbrB family looped-hinge helix DNA binding protein
MTQMLTYKAEEIFEDIENDEKNVLMTIPEEVRNKMGWTEGDVLKINVEKGVISITKVEKDADGKE